MTIQPNPANNSPAEPSSSLTPGSDNGATPSQPSPAQPSGLVSHDDANAGQEPPPLSPSVPTPYPSAFATTPMLRPTPSSYANNPTVRGRPAIAIILILGIGLTILGLTLDQAILVWIGSLFTLLFSLRALWPVFKPAIVELITDRQVALASLGLLVAGLALMQVTGINQMVVHWLQKTNWEAAGALGEIFGAAGQVLIAVLAVFIAWRQYVISKDLTIQQNLLTAQQNLITQQQTIDAYFQGVSDLVLDDEGLLEDWPQERAIAEGRTAAILSSVDAVGKAKIIRFLSRSRLLTPLKRDRRLGRAILDGSGGYEEDREHGLRVIDLGVMLAKADLSGTDLRWTDLSDINLVSANLSHCDLVKANLARTIFYEANLAGADLKGARLFFGSLETASPRTRTDPPNYDTGAFTGAVLENANLSGVQNLSEEQRCYCCAWGGARTRSTIPGGCDGIPNLLGR